MKDKIKLVKIKGDSKFPVEFELHKMQANGELKSKLIKFTGNHACRVYWNSMYEGEPITNETNGDAKHD